MNATRSNGPKEEAEVEISDATEWKMDTWMAKMEEVVEEEWYVWKGIFKSEEFDGRDRFQDSIGRRNFLSQFKQFPTTYQPFVWVQNVHIIFLNNCQKSSQAPTIWKCV